MMKCLICLSYLMGFAEAIKRLGVGVKCATITSNQARVEEYHLKQLTPSPNGIIRAELDGTVFREPIFVNNIHGTVSCWKKPIVLGRHAYGDVYKNCEIKTPCAGLAELVFTGEDGTEIRRTIMNITIITYSLVLIQKLLHMKSMKKREKLSTKERHMIILIT